MLKSIPVITVNLQQPFLACIACITIHIISILDTKNSQGFSCVTTSSIKNPFMKPYISSFDYLKCHEVEKLNMLVTLFLNSVLASAGFFTMGILFSWPATALPSIRYL